MDKMQLYSYFRSSCAYRVRIALNLKGLPYDIIPIHLLKEGGEQHSEKYKKMNPSEQVPALLDNNVLIGQSMAILEYIEECFPTPALLPRAQADRAHIRQMCEIINSGIQPMQNLSLTQYFTNVLKVSEEQKQEWLNHWISKGFKSLETLLQKYSGTYCFGESLTFADCLLVPQVFAAKRMKVDLSLYPRALEVNDRCLALTDFIRASPDKQIDSEK